MLDQILCWIQQIGAMVLNALVGVVNLIILGLADFLNSTVLVALPSMPSAPTFGFLPSDVTMIFAGSEYYFPVAGILTWFAAFMLIWFGWLVLAVALRWGKVVPGDE